MIQRSVWWISSHQRVEKRILDPSQCNDQYQISKMDVIKILISKFMTFKVIL